jgi:hypothetical protein
MKRLMQTVAALPLFAIGAAAQDPAQLDALKKKMFEEQTVRLSMVDDVVKKKMLEEQTVRLNMVGAVAGPQVKGIPYSADEITEVNQVLGDGTRIHRETKVSVYRDSEGRTRRETPDNITISDPVAGTTYMVNPKTNAVRKLQTANNYIYRSSGAMTAGIPAMGEGVPTTFSVDTADGQTNIAVNGKQLDPKAVQELIAKAKAEGSAETKAGFQIVADGPVNGYAFATGARRVMVHPKAGEALGKKNIEGVIADGMRNAETIEAGAIGNDRPIQVVNEHWFSEELGMMVYSKRSDPRTGDEIFRVTNIRRGDPPAYLFQAPAETHGNERKM